MFIEVSVAEVLVFVDYFVFSLDRNFAFLFFFELDYVIVVDMVAFMIGEEVDFLVVVNLECFLISSRNMDV